MALQVRMTFTPTFFGKISENTSPSDPEQYKFRSSKLVLARMRVTFSIPSVIQVTKVGVGLIKHCVCIISAGHCLSNPQTRTMEKHNAHRCR